MNHEDLNRSLRIVITGGAGFLGSHICDRLIQMGKEVICIDNLITGNPDNIAHLVGNNRGFKFINYDVTNFIHIDGKVDAVLHFASPASPIDYLELPIQTLKVGALGTHKTLGLAKAKGARYLLASTSETYGDPLLNPQPEDYWGNVNPVGPRGVYDEAKRFAEALTMAYHRYHGLDTRIVRIFNTYGPLMRPNDGRVVSNFIVQALREEALTVYGDGKQTRSFCYISDMVDGIVKLLFAEPDPTKPVNSNQYRNSIHFPVNVGNPNELTVMEIARMVLRLTGSRSKIEFKPLPVDDPKVRRPDITKAKTLLGWEPRINIEKGLSETISYFRDKLRN
jgi:dTDP-glucose 4,6-dehydratase